jgi:integrase
VHPRFAGQTGDRYDRRGYRQAVARASDRAFSHPAVSELQAKIQAAPKGSRRRAMAELRAWKEEHQAELRNWRDEHRWSPLQLRHTFATLIRARYGLEATSNVLGHAKADVTQIYAERDLAQARQIAAEVG